MLSKSQAKYIQSLTEKKFRTAEGVFVAEGPKIVQELLNTPGVEAVGLYGLEGWINSSNGDNPVAVTTVSEAELGKISSLVTPNKVLGLFRQPLTDAAPRYAGRLSLALDGIQDPGNLGTIVRIADWFGIRYIIASPDSADVFNPKVVQATMGSVGRVQVIYQPLEELLAAQPGIAAYAATLQGQPVQVFGKLPEGFLLVGNESRGLQPALVSRSAHQVSIPAVGKAESLNAAVATGILLSHLV